MGQGHSMQREVYARTLKGKRCSWSMEKEGRTFYVIFLKVSVEIFFLECGKSNSSDFLFLCAQNYNKIS